MYDFLFDDRTIEWGDSSLYKTRTMIKSINYETSDVQNIMYNAYYTT